VDELIVQEFVEPIQLFDQELVEILDDSSHHSDTVCLDRVKHLVDSDRLDLLGLNCRFDEDSSVDVVVVF
jgi:hypothetical protein